MKVPRKIFRVSKRLKAGHRVNRVTVRDFLNHFGAERRGAVKVEEIRRILDALDLETEPDFVSVWIDEPIRLRLKTGVDSAQNAAEQLDENGGEEENLDPDEIVLEGTPSAVEQALEQSQAAPTSSAPDVPRSDVGSEGTTTDPTFRIGSLPAANKALISVNQDDSISTAVTLMLQYDFSQLPVMQGEREVKGIVTWKSVCSRLALGGKIGRVGDCCEEVRIVDANRTLFDVIPTIVEYGYVLVRARDRKITGIVTASDLSMQFHTLTEPFLLLREIELHVRRLLQRRLSTDDLSCLANTSFPTRVPKQIADLNFGEYVRLVQSPDVSAKLNLPIDSSVLMRLLDDVRTIRNDVMHFDPDPMTADQLATLKRAARFMQELFGLLP
jgi:CBS domain-containing protein